METDYFSFVIPLFLLLIGLESLFSYLHGDGFYSIGDTLTDLGCGVIQFVVLALLRGATTLIYIWVFEHYGLWTVSEASVLAWVAVLLGVDFGYYCFHRLSHTVSFLWSFHSPHHQSEEYNLAVSLRQGSFEAFFDWMFFLPLALIGFPPTMFLTAATAVILYQFWLHTRYIGRLGVLEWVLCTPSNHRVHHGRNPHYLDKNYGAVLIIWDRIFGTFAEEVEPVQYGTLAAFRQFNPVWAHVQHLTLLASHSWRTPRLWDKIQLWFRPPGWRPPNDRGSNEEAAPAAYAPPRSPAVTALIVIDFLIVSAAALAVASWPEQLPLHLVLSALGFVVVGLATLDGLLRREVWAYWFAVLRYTSFAGYLVMVLGLTTSLR